MKKISYIFFDLLTIAFLIGAYAIQYFTKKKLGMLRWVNYHNMQFQKNAVYGIVYYSSCGNCADCADYCRI